MSKTSAAGGIKVDTTGPREEAYRTLPSKAAEKLFTLEQKREAGFSLARDAQYRVNETRKGVQHAEVRLASLQASSVDKAMIADAGRALEMLRAREASEEKQRIDRGAEAQQISALHSAVLDWLRDLPASCPLVEAGESAQQPAAVGNNWAATVAEHRSEIAHLRAEIRRVKNAPIPSTAAKVAARKFVDELVERGRPDIQPFVDGKTTSISFPEIQLYGFGGYSGSIIDVAAHQAWLDPAKYLARLENEIERVSDDKSALSEADRDRQTAQLMAALLTVERAEEATIEACEHEGGSIIRRRDADPRAVLGLSDSLRAPKSS
jgi:hypothetical protein